MLVHAYNLSTQAAEAGVGEFEPAWATQQECFKSFKETEICTKWDQYVYKNCTNKPNKKPLHKEISIKNHNIYNLSTNGHGNFS